MSIVTALASRILFVKTAYCDGVEDVGLMEGDAKRSSRECQARDVCTV